MIKNLAKATFRFLPYEFRRSVYRLKEPELYNNFQKMRKIETKTYYSYKPFDDKKCIFVHIPKSAGISISKSLFGNLGGGHVPIKRYQIIFSKQEFHNYFKFAFVRNPWDRLVSAYFFLKQGGMNEKDKKWVEKNLSRYDDFNTFVREWLNETNIQAYYHFKPQYQFICDYNFVPLVDFIGYYENLDRDYDYIRQRMHMFEELKFENVTKFRKKDYKSYYCADTKQIVSKVYQKDIEIFGYSFDNSSLEKQLKARDANFKCHVNKELNKA